MRVYIAGPIAGNPDYKVQFACAVSIIKAQTKEDDANIFNPAAELEGMAEWLPYDELMHICCTIVRNCDAIVMLPGWQNSTGAKRELGEALCDGLTAIELKDGKLCPLDVPFVGGGYMPQGNADDAE